MVAIKSRKSSNKNPPILSHEYIIQNHADIVSCVAIVFVIGFMIQATSAWAYIFIVINHNVSTINDQEANAPWMPPRYTTGWKDSCAVFFYFLITIIMHAVVQEYIIDKIAKRLHLSKIKLSKFNESSQLLVFYAISIIWGVDIISRDNLIPEITSFWNSYPMLMSFTLKLFFVAQLAYWLHSYPELYFQRVKKEEMRPRIVHATVGLFFTLAGYIFNFQHITLILLIIHYLGDFAQHGARLIHIIYRKEQTTKFAFSIANVTFLFSRVATLAFVILFYIYGLGQIDSKLDYTTGQFNIPAVRYSAFALVSLFQVYLIYDFMKRQIQRSKEHSGTSVVSKIKSKQQKLKKKDGKKSKEDDDLPEVDQATKKKMKIK